MALTTEITVVTRRTKGELHELLGLTPAWYNNAVNERSIIDLDEVRTIMENSEDNENEDGLADLMDQIDDLLQADELFKREPVVIENVNYVEVYVG